MVRFICHAHSRSDRIRLAVLSLCSSDSTRNLPHCILRSDRPQFVAPRGKVLNSNPFDSPRAAEPTKDSLNDRNGRSRRVQQRTVRVLWIAPFLIAVPVFFAVAELIPDQSDGSIGDGFRKMKVYLGVVGPITICCWGPALLLAALNDIPLIPRSRWFAWLIVIAMLIAIAATLAALDL